MVWYYVQIACYTFFVSVNSVVNLSTCIHEYTPPKRRCQPFTSTPLWGETACRGKQHEQRFGIVKLCWGMSGLGLSSSHTSSLSSSSSPKTSLVPLPGSLSQVPVCALHSSPVGEVAEWGVECRPGSYTLGLYPCCAVG